MDETKVIKVLLLTSQEIVVSEIEEVAAEFGDPNCKLTKPYKIEGGWTIAHSGFTSFSM